MAFELGAVEQSIGILLLNGGWIPAGTPVEPAPYPPAEPTPAIIYSLVSSGDVTVIGGYRILTHCIYQIVAIAQGQTLAALNGLPLAIDQSLCPNDRPGSCVTSDGTVLTITRDRPISIPKRADSGVVMQAAGGWYRFQVGGSS